jgi:DNA-binding NarL/FixJ family response regulator
MREVQAAGCTAPILLLTRYADSRLEAEALASGAAGFLNKNNTSAATLEKALVAALQRTFPPPKAP